MPSRLRALPSIDARLMCIRSLPIINTRLRAYAPYAPVRLYSPISALRLSIVRYDLRLKNPRKATGTDFIPLKLIKFASNVIDSHLYNIIIKDLEKASTQKSQKQH